MAADVLLNVIIPTYNHQNYIAQAIESVLVQNCNFNYQIIIGEDCSTDDTRRICEKYESENSGKIVLLKNNSNLGLVRNYQRLFEACKGKYVAILEGDDYWVNLLKLQSQVDILEAYPEVGLVHTKCCSIYENGQVKVNTHLYHSNKKSYDLYNDVILGNYTIVPVTACFRLELFRKYVDFNFCVANELVTIDSFMWPELAYHSKFHFIDEVTGYYRVLSNSISNSKNFDNFLRWYEKGILTLNYYNFKYPLSKEDGLILYSKLGYLAVRIGLENRRKEFVLRNIGLVKDRSFKATSLLIIARNPRLYFLYPLHNYLISLLSSIKQFLYSRQFFTLRCL